MKDNKTKIKKEKGATGLDVATGVVIFMLFSTFILTLYVQIYKQTSIIKIHEDAMGYIISICEDIDMRNYGDTEDLQQYTELIKTKIGLPEDRYNLQISQEKYISTHPDAEDIVKRLTISITYNFDEEDRVITVNKIKVKEEE